MAKAIQPALTEELQPVCNRVVGSRPTWMSADQYDPCYCIKPKDHEPPCVCEHGIEQRNKYG